VSNGDNVEVELKTKPAENNESGKPIWEVHIKNIRKTPGRYYESIFLTTDFEIMPEMTIRVFGNIQIKDKTKPTE
jgi:hypothetical protein